MDLGRRFGLYTSLKIPCPRCGSGVRIDAGVIAQNWAFNFGWVGFLLSWAGLAIGVLASPDLAATVGGNTFPSATEHDRLVLAGMSVFWALLAALALAGVGMVLGGIVAAVGALDRDDAVEAPPPPPGPAGGFRFLPLGGEQQRSPAAAVGFYPQGPTAPAPRPPRRGFFVRAFFALLWPVVFFFAAALGLSIVAMSQAKKVDQPLPAVAVSTVGLMASPRGQAPLLAASSLVPARAVDQQLKQQAERGMGERSAPWLLLGMLVVFILGCAGLLPNTGRLKPRPAPPRRAPAESGSFDLRNYPIDAGAEPPRRHAGVRCLFALLWPVLFFVAAAVATAALSGASAAENDVVRKQMQDQWAQLTVPWVMLGSLVVFVLGCVGLLPWTGQHKRGRAAAPAAPATPPAAPPAGDSSSPFFRPKSLRNQ
jgi:hypothetical protein